MLRNLRTSFFRYSSNSVSTKTVNVKIAENGVTTLALNSPPVNTLTRQVLDDLTSSIEYVVSNNGTGIILTSEKPGVFCSGLDIFTIHGASKEEFIEFWTKFQNLWLTIYTCPLPVIAAINGASPAGGCVLATLCDYRIMVDNQRYIIGLNETLLGLVCPQMIIDAYVNTVGQREAELSLQLGTLYSGKKALEIGLIDELVSYENLESQANLQIEKWLKVPPKARAITKKLLRQNTVNNLVDNRQLETEKSWDLISKPSVQKDLGRYIEMMKAKSKK